MATKWREFLTTYALVPQPHPVMLAWMEFAKLLEPEFAAKAGWFEMVVKALREAAMPPPAPAPTLISI